MAGLGRAGPTLEMDSSHKNDKIGFYPKSLRPFLRILCVVDDSDIYMQKEFLVRSAHHWCPRFASLAISLREREIVSSTLLATGEGLKSLRR